MRKIPPNQPPVEAVTAIVDFLRGKRSSLKLGGGDERFLLRCEADARAFGAELLFTEARQRQWDELMFKFEPQLLELADKHPSLRIWIKGAVA